jgi:hypothetical protein
MDKKFGSIKEILQHFYPDTWEQQLEDLEHCPGCRCDRSAKEVRPGVFVVSKSHSIFAPKETNG